MTPSSAHLFCMDLKRGHLSKIKKKLNAFGTSCYRIMLGIRRLCQITNSYVLQPTKRSNLVDMLINIQLRVLGHWLRRLVESTMNRYALFTTNEGRGRRRRPLTTYVQYITSTANLNVEQTRRIAAERDEWRRLVFRRGDSRAPNYVK